MIRKIVDQDYPLMEDFLKEDIARNYFTLLGITSKKNPYQLIYGDFHDDKLSGLLFLRKTGLLQFYVREDADFKAWSEIIKELDYTGMIAPSSYSDNLIDYDAFSMVDPGAYIAKLDKEKKLSPTSHDKKIRSLGLEDLDLVVEVYKECFKSFAPKAVMEDKLLTGRGRALGLEIDGKLVSIAQTDFEVDGGALIVGVATKPAYRDRGLASLCLEEIIQELQAEGKDLYLQYDNPDAGKIYKRLGFEDIDQVKHYKR